MQNFREFYKPDTWFVHEDKQAVKPLTRPDFTLASASFPELSRTERCLSRPLQDGELYVVNEIYESVAGVPKDSEQHLRLRVFTHVFRTVEEARQGFFYLLWGAERLNTRAEGVPDVGEVSYGRGIYLCFLRNNLVIRVLNIGICAKGIPEEFVRQIDRQIMERSE